MLRLDAPDGGVVTVGAGQALMSDGDVEARNAWITTCACRPPLWLISARRLRLEDDGDLWLTSPVLRVGRLSVLWLPALLVRTGRQPGLRPPRIEWRGEEGLLAGLDVTTPIGSEDIDIGVAALSHGPAEVGARAEGPWLSGAVTARSDGVLSNGALVAGEGEPDSAALLVRWDLASTPEIRSRRATTIEAAAIRPRPLDAFAVAATDGLSVASGASLRQTVSLGRLVLAGALPSLSVRSDPLVIGGRALADLLLVADRRFPSETLRASVSPRLEIGLPVWPLRIRTAGRLEATGWRGPLLGDDGTARLAGSVGATVALPLERRWRTIVHSLEPAVAASLTDVPFERGPSPPRIDDLDAPVEGLLAEATLASRLTLPSGDELLSTEVGALAAPWSELRLAFLKLEAPLGPLEAGFSGAFDLARGQWTTHASAALRVGRSLLAIEHAHLSEGRSLLSSARVQPGELAIQDRPVSPAELGGARAAVGLGPRWTLASSAWVDLEASRLAAIDGSVVWTSACGCLTLGLEAVTWAGRELPDVRATVSVE